MNLESKKTEVWAIVTRQHSELHKKQLAVYF
jgi:hypothetical protein